ncbi:molecular chaperone HtpG [Solitalea sp. MAHUQ-68]|uniref:Chaperone protein HtpG n=1 Tax=Solitalea agri TaxID=2953739 RepID=A0A9X2FA77_9SPHI|nr:molecular chaperone HtpG [Solitalea agri]MCO4294768.1 molecular chaperone HtpG [Solitalea agri]
MAQKGSISVNTENIFPIIKKFLYSDHDIFLRELVANATDATQKLQKLSGIGDFKGELGDLSIHISVDKENKTLTISDRGIGMSEEEVMKYINQVAFSGATEFVEKFKDIDTTSIIGKFGLGFYSAFMVAEKVELITKSYKDAPAVKWTCDGSTEFSIEEVEKADRGTDIILYLNSDSEEFIEEHKIQEILNRYCRFMPIKIVFGKDTETVKEGDEEKTIEKDHVINAVQPLYTRDPQSLKDEDYLNFYRELYPMAEEPLFWIHLNVDYPFNLTGILYFPKVKNDITLHKDKIQLYSRQVFITDNVENIVPEFLRLMHGVIDSPDIPLNVSRSYLQSDANVKKISSYITRKVADRLEELFKTDRVLFEQKWESVGLFVKYGMVTEEKFFEKAQKFCLYESLDGKLSTLEEYKEKIKDNQVDKNGNYTLIYTSKPALQDIFIRAAKNRGFDVLKMDALIDNHFISNVEYKLDKVRMKRVDADTVDKLIETDTQLDVALTEDQKKEVDAIFKKATGNDKLDLEVAAMSGDEMPVTIVRPEFMRRMMEMQELSGGNGGMFGFNGFGAEKVMVNGNHALILKLLSADAEKQSQLARQAYDLALLAQGMLKGEALTGFIQRSIELVD